MMEGSLEGIPEVGEVLLSKYRIEGILGRGGMGAVVAATHLGLQQPVAIKFMLGHRSTNPVARERFEREARAAAAIRSEHVCRVMDVGVLDAGTLYLVMEHLSGSDLQVLMKQGAVPLANAVNYLLQACEALALAHALGIVHRDLKPANLFVSTAADGQPCVKLLDFGISKLTDEFDTDIESLTATAALMGSPLYMAPEQMVSAKAVDARADIWALGCIFYEMLAGRAPFLAKLLPEVCVKVLKEEPPSFASLGVEAPSRAEAICLRCLQKEPAERYRHVAEFATALAELGDVEAKRLAAKVERIVGGAPEDAAVKDVAVLADTALSEETVSGQAVANNEPGKGEASASSLVVTTHAPLSRAEQGDVGRPIQAKRARSGTWAAAGLVSILIVVGLLFFGLRSMVMPTTEATTSPSRSSSASRSGAAPQGITSKAIPSIQSSASKQTSQGATEGAVQPKAGGSAGGQASEGADTSAQAPQRRANPASRTRATNGTKPSSTSKPAVRPQPRKPTAPLPTATPKSGGPKGLFDKRDPSADLFGERSP